jgi:hypothetical protein
MANLGESTFLKQKRINSQEDVHILRNAIFQLFRPPLPPCNKKPYKSLYPCNGL